MMKRLFLISVALFFPAHNAYTQAPHFDYPEIKLVRTNDVEMDDLGTVLVSDYLVEAKQLRLTEARLNGESNVAKILKSRVALLEQCKFSRSLQYQGKEVGQLHECMKSGTHTLIYSYGEKFYEISSKSIDAISLFTKHILPMACHLYGSKECVSMYY